MCETTVGEAAESPDSGDNVLVLAPPFTRDVFTTGLNALDPGGSDSERVLCVTFTRSPEDHLAEWRRHLGRTPDRIAFVSVDATARSRELSGGTTGGPQSDESGVTVDRIRSAENLTELGIRITNRLDAWSDASDPRIVVCFDSVTALLQYVDLERAFRFLHVLTDRFADAGATSYYHMDPDAHDDETIDTLSTLFDAVCEYDDGEWTARS